MRGSPMAPAASHSRTRPIAGRKRVHIASIRKTFSARATATTSSSSAALTVNGFSHSTAFFARRQRMASARCMGCGVPM